MSDDIPPQNFMLWDYAEVLPRIAEHAKLTSERIAKLTTEHKDKKYNRVNKQRLAMYVKELQDISTRFGYYFVEMKTELDKLP